MDSFGNGAAEVNYRSLRMSRYRQASPPHWPSAVSGCGHTSSVIEVDLQDQDTAMPCYACGSVSERQGKSRAGFMCSDCRHTESADLNAARNILFFALPGRAMAPRETSRGPGPQGAQTAIGKSVWTGHHAYIGEPRQRRWESRICRAWRISVTCVVGFLRERRDMAC